MFVGFKNKYLMFLKILRATVPYVFWITTSNYKLAYKLGVECFYRRTPSLMHSSVFETRNVTSNGNEWLENKCSAKLNF